MAGADPCRTPIRWCSATAFIYSNCMQPAFRSLQGLTPGSIVLFGRYGRDPHGHSFGLDTCLVIESREAMRPCGEGWGEDILSDAVLVPWPRRARRSSHGLRGAFRAGRAVQLGTGAARPSATATVRTDAALAGGRPVGDPESRKEPGHQGCPRSLSLPAGCHLAGSRATGGGAGLRARLPPLATPAAVGVTGTGSRIGNAGPARALSRACRYPRMDWETLTNAELLALSGGALAELRARGVVRTANAPAGDLAERLVADAMGGELAPNAQKSWDVLVRATVADAPAQRIQVKARVVTDSRQRRPTSGLRLPLVGLRVGDVRAVRSGVPSALSCAGGD